ncbi:hypothetical protein F5148DRAFT_1211092 [Russula earlei]|uniref:Uncharacterized protein n=1 Tax=Russula earlei TaxID=71964 RepID=A0ACC0U553_9AGAM|nr:hypothetical protein F5148DRAFT_1211092 [Russula earlei]
MSHCNTFREELAIRYPMLVGDVGVIRGGRFHRLFNALRGHQPSDPDHRDGLRYPRQLQPRTPNHIIRSRDYQKDFPSKNVTKVDRGLNIHALGPDDGTQITISCSGRLGASISLPFPADSEDTIAHGDFSRWIIKNIDDCMRLADDLGWGVNRMEDIILVTGCHLAKSWANAAFSETRGGAEVSFSIRVSGHSGVHLEERNMSEGVLKLGPSGEVGYRTNSLVEHGPF